MKYRKQLLVLSFVVVMAFTGCADKEQSDKTTKIVLTTGFGEDEVFRIEKSSCTLPEVMVYLTNVKNQYEDVFGSEIWNTSYEGETLENNIKERIKWNKLDL